MLTENDLKFFGAVMIKSAYPHFTLEQSAEMSRKIFNIVFDNQDKPEILHD